MKPIMLQRLPTPIPNRTMRPKIEAPPTEMYSFGTLVLAYVAIGQRRRFKNDE